ncbi:G-protein-signaling modulator 2 isoform X2 [Lingula anatina]|uniref:G-protein-signaling modulator 2 isoform X1 n=1 Tax=Lingula anatina TaxID=7574 RepID=A0A1S3KCE9_LINAN|nr:G-protein-signaling modulator 2 isoform X1 [Lingula anatina]XP_013420308.1 G-protein-signaling modulator 2 isoform X1 [Lingula anatina]XP_013420309.1 G-protein-signaling modulator 2 isoform X2 [Lingula anatina]|eukprot:XP_013420307.1 G-protein-signaling modulator 2 isoform X1 [Lingula anatina]
MEGSCMELALEGERLCKAGDCRAGVQYFEAAVQIGTDDLKTLTAIYSQLGNAYFYLGEYGKALEYHRHDLNLARTIGDKLGEAKASGNLGNTLKVLGKFEEAIACCERHLEISRELGEKVGEARALYNLGNVYHAKGKQVGRNGQQDPGEFTPEVKEALQQAADYYEENLKIVQELGDRAAEGRACGNLGNTHYLLGNFAQAIRYHEERLAIAKEFGDKAAERRAYSNLGNAHIFLGEFEVAADHYKKTLQIAKQLQDRALEAQACYSLGNTYTLLRDYDKAIEYHLRHLRIAQELQDRIGEGRACWSLGNAHTALGNHEQALQFASKHLLISKEIGDSTGEATAKMNLSDLRTLLGISPSERLPSDLDTSSISTDQQSLASSYTTTDSDRTDDSGGTRNSNRQRRHSMENMELMKLTPDKKNHKSHTKPKSHRLQKSATVATDIDVENRDPQSSGDTVHAAKVVTLKTIGKGHTTDFSGNDEDDFFNQIMKFQSRRMEDQRCSFKVTGDHPVPNKNSLALSGKADEFLDMVAGIQGSRMNDQRAHLPQFPGLNNSQAVIGQLLHNSPDTAVPDDNFFEMLMRCQGTRLEDQRSHLQPVDVRSAPTVPDEDFFTLIQRIQSNRLDEQRSVLPPKKQSETDQDTKNVTEPSTVNGKKKKK